MTHSRCLATETPPSSLTSARVPDLQAATASLAFAQTSENIADVINSQGVLSFDVPLLPKPFTSRALLTKIREALDS